MWPGEHKAHFVPALVAPLLEVTLVPEVELRRATLPVFYDMMEAEQNAKGCFRQVSQSTHRCSRLQRPRAL